MVDAVEYARERDELEESNKNRKVFICKELSENGETYYIDLRNGFKFYAYNSEGSIPKEDMENLPIYGKKIRSFKQAEKSKSLSEF